MSEAAKHFDDRVATLLSHIIDPTGHTTIPYATVHSVDGCGAPDYFMNRTTLWDAHKHMALTDAPEAPRLSLITPSSDTTRAASQVEAPWMFYNASHHLSPALFSAALGIRLGVLPPHLQLRGICGCGHQFTPSDGEDIEHVLRCDQASHRGHTYRHDLVRDSIIHTARGFGLSATKEPRCFTYSDGSRKRPDIIIHTSPVSVVTDVTMVHEDCDLQTEERKKSEKHSEAAAKEHCVFVPFAMFTRGTKGPKATHFIKLISRGIQPHLQREFFKSMAHTIATAAARGRAESIYAAAHRLQW